MKIRIGLVLIFTVLGALSFFRWIPHAIDAKMNGLGPRPSEQDLSGVPALHSDLFVVDLHADTLLWDRDLNTRASRGHVDLPRLREGGVDLQIFSVVTKSPRGLNYEGNAADSDNITMLALAQRWPLRTWRKLSERALYQARKLHEAAADSDGKLRIIRSQTDLTEFLELKKNDHELVGGILAIEGAHALDGDLELLDEMDRAGFRMIAPVHMFDTELAGSAQGIERGGLTDLGRRWVAEMDRRKLIIDLAHVSEPAIDEILDLSVRAPVVSHTGFKAICETRRNLSDRQLKRIGERGGLVGVGFWPEVTCELSLESIAKSLEHAVRVAGEDAVALGSDWDGTVTTPIDASQMGLLTKTLIERGWSEELIRKVMGGNARRFFERWLPDGQDLSKEEGAYISPSSRSVSSSSTSGVPSGDH